MAGLSAAELAARIEHTRLQPHTARTEIDRLIEEALTHGFRAVCVPPWYVNYTAEKIPAESSLRVISVVGFPTGYHPTPVKTAEAEQLIADGADELDMVMNNAAFRSGDLRAVKADMAAVVSTCHRYHIPCKVIIETGLLDTAENIATAARLAAEAGADYVKTSTGFFGRGATVEDVRTIRQAIPPQVKIKASGGIRTAEQARRLIEAGADVLGASQGIAILQAMKR